MQSEIYVAYLLASEQDTVRWICLLFFRKFIMIFCCLDLAAFHLILHFHLCKIAWSADVAKIFRQIILHPADTDYQRFLWHLEDNAFLKVARMKRLTFGNTSSPFFATAVMKNVANNLSTFIPRQLLSCCLTLWTIA